MTDRIWSRRLNEALVLLAIPHVNFLMQKVPEGEELEYKADLQFEEREVVDEYKADMSIGGIVIYRDYRLSCPRSDVEDLIWIDPTVDLKLFERLTPREQYKSTTMLPALKSEKKKNNHQGHIRVFCKTCGKDWRSDHFKEHLNRKKYTKCLAAALDEQLKQGKEN